MSAKKGKAKKNIAPEKKVQRQYPIKTSDECEVCEVQCPRGVKYVKNLHATGRGNGVVCKLKGV